MSPFLILIAAVTAADPRATPCRVATPAAAAEQLYVAFKDFHQRPDAAAALLSPRFLRLLERDRACSEVEQCAISADPWSGAQDGEILPPVTFAQLPGTKRSALVRACYRFSLDATRNEMCAVVVTMRDAKGCWRVDDVKAPDDTSLRRALSDYDYGD